MATTSRLLTLLSLLQARRDWPVSVLASRLDVSDRTVRRDIDRLREMSYRIETTMGPGGGYRLDAGAEMPPLLFDDDQALAVAIALRAAPALARTSARRRCAHSRRCGRCCRRGCGIGSTLWR